MGCDLPWKWLLHYFYRTYKKLPLVCTFNSKQQRQFDPKRMQRGADNLPSILLDLKKLLNSSVEDWYCCLLMTGFTGCLLLQDGLQSPMMIISLLIIINSLATPLLTTPQNFNNFDPIPTSIARKHFNVEGK